MPGFNRHSIKPHAGFVYNLVLRSIASWIPTGFRWFEARSLEDDRELGQEIRAWARVISTLRHAIQVQRYNIFLSSAVGSALDALGTALGFKRKTAELDDPYANRIAAELVAERVTPGAIERFVPRITDGEVNAVVYEPWRDLWVLDEKRKSPTRASSRGRHTNDQRYNHGGVFELQVDGHVEGLDEALDELKACGTHYWHALMMEGAVNWVDDPLVAIWPLDGKPMNFVTNSIDVTIDSFIPTVDFDVVVLELPASLDVVFGASTFLSWCMGLRFDRLPRNYALSMNMLASAASGVPVYEVVVTTPFDPRAATDVQSHPEIQFEILMDDGWDMGGAGPPVLGG